MGKTKMTSKAASRIQSHSDKTGKNQGFKSRAQSAADKKANQIMKDRKEESRVD